MIYQIITEVILIIGLGYLTYTDLKSKKVPNKILLALIGAWAVVMTVRFVTDTQEAAAVMGNSLIGFAIAGGIFLLTYFVSKKQIGGGDVKLAAVMGLYLTSEKIFTALLAGLLVCAIFSIVLILMKKADKKTEIPLVPFLCFGAVVALVLSYLG